MSSAARSPVLTHELGGLRAKLDPHQPIPLIGVTDALPLGYAMVVASDGKASAAVRRESGRLARAVEVLEAARGQSQQRPPPTEPIDAMARAVSALSCILVILDAHAALASDAPEVQLARDTRRGLVPTGINLSRRPRRQQWLLIKEVRDRAPEGSDLAANVNYLAGEWAWSTMQHWHDEAGRALGLTVALPTQPASSVRLVDAMRAFRERLAAYVRAVLGEVDEEDPASVARAERMLAPLVQLREDLAGKRGSGARGAEDGGDVVVPVAPVAPAAPVTADE